MDTLKNFFVKNKRFLLVILFTFFYITAFKYLERRNTEDYILVHTKIDEMIPFCEYFIIPYLVWFFYVTVTIILLGMKDRNNYYKTIVYLALGMVFFIVFSYLVPNGHDLRPDLQSIDRNNYFIRLMRVLYRKDTATNILPSIHVYNSIACHIGICKYNFSKGKKTIRFISFFTCILIIISTMLCKQHSVVDVIFAIVLNIVFYPLSYYINWSALVDRIKMRLRISC